MSSETPLSKRIKRHVVGRLRTYFAATSPGFENICLGELHDLPLSKKTASIVPGGVEFQGQLMDCYLANLYLRTANRILMRIHTFKASNFTQLEKKLFDIPWELYLRAEQHPKIHVSNRHCRLYHSEAISERILTGITNRKAKEDFIEDKEGISSVRQNVYVRGVDDHFTISIDSSGNNLYKRGIKKHPGAAPLRETTAAAALMLAGYTGSKPLLDPMCGSGTISLEAALVAKNIPPGWFRDFAFMHWPSFQSKRWAYLKRQSENLVVHLIKPMIRASDTDPSACSRLEKCIAEFNLSDAVTIDHKNFFDLYPTEPTDQMGFVAINPPYGRRIGSKRESEKLFEAICGQLKQHYKGWKLVLFVPHKKLTKHIPFKLREYPVSHGGIRLRLMVGRIA